LAAGPPPPGGAKALAITGLTVLVVVGLMNPIPEETITWPALYAALASAPK